MTTERVTVSGVSQSWEDEVSLQREPTESANPDSQPVWSPESGLPCQEEPANRGIRAIPPVLVSHLFPFGPSRRRVLTQTTGEKRCSRNRIPLDDPGHFEHDDFTSVAALRS